MRALRSIRPLLLISLLAAAACGDEGRHDPDDEHGHGGGEGGGGGGGSEEPDATFSVRETIGQLYVWSATPGLRLELRNGRDETVALGVTDALGSYVFRQVPPGDGYVIRTVGAEPAERTGPLRVLSGTEDPPPQEFYASQRLVAGYQYLTMRDGTTLAAYVTLPGPPEDGPYPTVVNYSGYDPARPGEPVSNGQFEALCGDFPTLCDAPADASALIASFMGYATVGVNVRGTGCSGGAFDFYEPLQLVDGYDVIEIVAAQPWVKHGKVGMTGLSYPGNSQLFVASMRPPGLAAITPLSVIGNTATTLYPGGILNKGFALIWAENVLDRAGPYAQGWEQPRVEGGDTVCEQNQLLHDQRVDIITKAKAVTFYDPAIVDPLNPSLFAERIDVPVFLAGAWQDEQTGPFFHTLLDRFASAPVRRFTVYNGVHPDGFSPQVLVEWKTFLDLYVAREVPKIDGAVRNLAPLLFQEIFGVTLPMPPDRLDGFATWEEARAAYEAEPELRVILENGAEEPLGGPKGRSERSFAAWPPPETEPVRLYLQPDGTLAPDAPTAEESASRFAVDPYAGDASVMAPGGYIWDALPDYDWKQPVPGSAVVFESGPLSRDTLLIGTASADLWVRSWAADMDLEATISEVRPDGKETYVQSGWLRVSQRKLKETATELWPEPTHLREDHQPLQPGEWTEARVAIAGFSHPFRAGSKVRLTVDTPGGTRSDWRFDLVDFDAPTWHSVGHSAAHPSSVVLPVIPGAAFDTALPPCPSLRGQPCRDHVPYTNVAE